MILIYLTLWFKTRYSKPQVKSYFPRIRAFCLRPVITVAKNFGYPLAHICSHRDDIPCYLSEIPQDIYNLFSQGIMSRAARRTIPDYDEVTESPNDRVVNPDVRTSRKLVRAIKLKMAIR